jgi:HlyD family secretion protein
MKTKTRWMLAAAAAALVLIALAVVRQRGSPVQVTPVVRTSIVQSITATGRLNAPARMDVGSDVSATVLEVRVREGDTVRAGQLLVRLQDGEARAAVQQAQGALQEARGRAVQQTTVTAPVATQAVVQAQSAFATAQREFQRSQELVAQGFFSQQKLDDARRALDTARSALESARVQAGANQANGIEPQLAASRTAQAQAALEAAQARLARLQITSPVDAVVLSRMVEPGGLAQPGKALLSLAAQGAPRIDAAVDEKHLRLLTLGMPAKALADAFVGQAFDAKLSYIAPLVDAQRGTVDVRLAVLAPPAFLKPDMTVSVELIGAAHKDALVLPSVAVRDADKPAPWVLVAQDGTAVRVPVELGLRGVGSIEIVKGLAQGDLAISQTEKAVAGDKVRAAQAVATQAGMEVPSFIQR